MVEQTGAYLPEHVGAQTPYLRCVLLPLLHPASSAEQRVCEGTELRPASLLSFPGSSQQGWRARLPLKAEPVTSFLSMQQGDGDE